MKNLIVALLPFYIAMSASAIVVGNEQRLSNYGTPTVDVAAGIGEAMICWTDSRGQVEVARIDQTGSPIGASTVIAPDSGLQGYPHIAFDGVHYLVVWIEISSQPAGSGTLSARLLNFDGSPAGDVVVISNSIALYQLGAPVTLTYPPSVLWNGNRYLVVWSKGWNANVEPVTAAVSLTADAQIENEVTIPVRAGTYAWSASFTSTVDSHGNALFAWGWYSNDGTSAGIDAALLDQNFDVRGIVTLDSATTNPSGLSSLLVPQQPGVASTGDRFLVAWTKYAASSSASELRATLLDPNGQIVNPVSQLIDQTAGPDSDLDAHLCWDGQHFLLAWRRLSGGTSAEIFGVQITSALSMEAPFTVAPSVQANGFWGSINMTALSSERIAVAYVTYGVSLRVLYTNLEPRRRSVRPF